MVNQVVTSRLRPQLVRKNTVVKIPPTVKAVVKALNKPVATQEQVKKAKQKAKLQAQPKPVRKVPVVAQLGAVVQKKTRRNVKRRRKPQVKYVTRDVSSESLSKIRKLQGIGTNKILVIVGNGPSISEAPLEKLANIDNIDILSINQPDKRVWPTKYWAFFDSSQLKRHKELWNNYDGTIFNSTAIKNQKDLSMQFKNIGGQGFSRDLSSGLYIGRSSVYASMQLALWMNYSHTYIFGCDMNPEGLDGKLHFYGVNPDVDPKNRADRFAKEAEHYDVAARVLSEEERSKFTFCSDYNHWEFVSKFNRASHKDVSRILNND